MSDTFRTIVSEKTSQLNAQDVANKVVQFLTENNIIRKELTDCVLGGNGHEPAENFISILKKPYYGLLELSVNGVEIITEKQIFHNGGYGLNAILCPNCGENQIENDAWGTAMENWSEQNQNDSLKCSNCSTETSILGYKFEPNWAFGNFGLKFWNWGEFKPEFISELETVVSSKLKIVSGII